MTYTRADRAKNAGKLTPAQVNQIRHDAAQGKTTIAEIAAFYGITKANVRAIVKRQTWQHLPYQPPHRQRKPVTIRLRDFPANTFDYTNS